MIEMTTKCCECDYCDRTDRIYPSGKSQEYVPYTCETETLCRLYMIGYGTGKTILNFQPFCQLNEEYQERENSK